VFDLIVKYVVAIEIAPFCTKKNKKQKGGKTNNF
jgi:hypothetical protein